MVDKSFRRGDQFRGSSGSFEGVGIRTISLFPLARCWVDMTWSRSSRVNVPGMALWSTFGAMVLWECLVGIESCYISSWKQLAGDKASLKHARDGICKLMQDKLSQINNPRQYFRPFRILLALSWHPSSYLQVINWGATIISARFLTWCGGSEEVMDNQTWCGIAVIRSVKSHIKSWEHDNRTNHFDYTSD